METTAFTIIGTAFLVLSFITVGLILWGLQKVLPRTSIQPAQQKKIFRNTVISILLWSLLVSVLALLGILGDFSTMPPKIMIALIIPLAVIISLLLFSKSLEEILAHTPPAWFLYIQFFRVPVELLLWASFVHHLAPVQMTFEGRNLDVLTGLTAPVFAWLCFSKGKMNKKLAIAWNIFGMILLVNILTVAILSMPTPFRVFMNEPSNTVVTQFPVVFLPAVLVPVAYTMHFFSLKQLLMKRN